MSVDHNIASAVRGILPVLSAEDKQMLLRLARQTLQNYLGDGKLCEWRTDSPALLEPRATFVTLRQRDSGELRGCRGEYIARRPLVESVARMALAAATDDSRFPPVTIDELPALNIEISALTPLKPIRPQEIAVGRHGLMIIKGGASGLLLPQVPLTYAWDRQAFLSGVCRKAALSDDAWKAPDVQLYGFETVAWSEEE